LKTTLETSINEMPHTTDIALYAVYGYRQDLAELGWAALNEMV
jgi:hypothetical protein